jgi:hypothetical protein
MRSWIGCLLCASATLAGCGGDDDSVERRGSPACQDFQDAVCDFGADRCKTIDRAVCDANLAGSECVSDQRASACANALNTTTCGQPVADCDLLQIIDRKPAVEACNQVFTALCKHQVTCNQIPTVEACVAALKATGFDCAQAVAVEPGFDECLAQSEHAPCSEAAPSACRGVVRVLSLNVTPPGP